MVGTEGVVTDKVVLISMCPCWLTDESKFPEASKSSTIMSVLISGDEV